MRLDEIDLSILRELSNDARVPVSAISSRVKLSIPAVSARIKKLEKGEYIEMYTTILNPSKFNKNLTCFSFINLRYDEAKLICFREFVQSEPEIMLATLRSKADVLTSSTSISLSTLKNIVSINI